VLEFTEGRLADSIHHAQCALDSTEARLVKLQAGRYTPFKTHSDTSHNPCRSVNPDSSSSKPSQQVIFETLPPILVLHLERFPYDAATEGIAKIRKPVQFAPELEIPLGTVFFFVSPAPAKAKNPSCLCWSRNHGTCFREIHRSGALQASWGPLLPRQSLQAAGTIWLMCSI
jgi:hypothetical protein